MKTNYQFPEILKYLRNQEGWPQSHLANKLNVSAGTYSAYERGVTEPNLSILDKLSKIFNVSIDFLVTGKEFAMPITNEQRDLRQADLITSRLENKIERQTRILSSIAGKLENDLATLVRNYINEYSEIFSRTSDTTILEEELWKIESCSRLTRVLYPNATEFLRYDSQAEDYIPNEYFYNIETNLRNRPDNNYIDIYSAEVEVKAISKYRELIVKHCGKAALKRIQSWHCKQSIIAQCVVYDLKLSMLRDKYPFLFDLTIDSVFDDRYLALIIAPQVEFQAANFLADKEHCRYIFNHFQYLLEISERI